MEKNYWLKGWEMGWKKSTPSHHQITENLIIYFSQLGLKKGDRIFVPLCGKSQDMLWLNQQGYKVTGVELSDIACHAFFIDNNLPFEVSKKGKFICYGNSEIELLCGDFFDLDAIMAHEFDAIYDHAALTALPFNVRQNYIRHITQISKKGISMLLIALESEYNDGYPPFSVSAAEVNLLFSQYFIIQTFLKQVVAKIPLTLALRAYKSMSSTVYLLKRKLSCHPGVVPRLPSTLSSRQGVAGSR